MAYESPTNAVRFTKVRQSVSGKVVLGGRVFCTSPEPAGVSMTMRKHNPALLLGLVLTAIVCDMILRSCPVHAQAPLTVYIDSAPHHFKERHDTLALKGTEVIGFHCADGSCYVLSK
jgi:hypothetical protein